MYWSAVFLGAVYVICHLTWTSAVETTLNVKPYLQEDNAEGQLKLYSPIFVNPDEFQHRGKLYKTVCKKNEKVDFFTAFRSCMNDGLQLVRDESAEDSQKLTQIVNSFGSGRQVWFGGTDLGKTGSWIWLAALRPVGHINGYTNWKSGEPSKKKHCMAAEITKTGELKWFAEDCDTALCYVCEKNLT